MTDGGDPSTRTIEQFRGEAQHARELSDARFSNLENQLLEKDKAIKLVQDRVSSQPTPDVLEQQILALKESVDIRFQSLKELASTLAVSNEKKLELALSSQQEAAKKSETAFNKQLDAVAERVNDIKDRTINMEAGEKGQKQSSASSLAVAAFVVSVIGAIMSVAVGITIILARSS